MQTYAYGFPRLGKKREFKRLVEAFWAGKLSEEELLAGISDLEERRRESYRSCWDGFPTGEMSLYDNILDWAILTSVERASTLNDYFELCRGKGALEMTKWFNTNYHYLVPDFGGKRPSFDLGALPFPKYKEGEENAFLVGPFTFLKLSKG